MSTFADDGAAAAALAAANLGEVAPPEVVTPEPVVEAPAVDAGTTSSDSFTDIDLNSVPEEIRSQVEEYQKRYQADYTRKTQEIAPIRSVMEQTGMSAEEAQQALQFVQGLNDPDKLKAFAAQLNEHLGGTDEVDDDDGNVDPRDRQIGDLSTRLERFEKQQMQQEAATTLASATQAVKDAFPDFQEADMTRVEQLAIAHMQGGKDIQTSLSNAAKEYQAWKDETLQSYIANKGNVAASGGKPLVGGTHAQTPETFKNLDEATKAALTTFGQDWVN